MRETHWQKLLFYLIIIEILFFSGEIRIYHEVLGVKYCIPLFLSSTLLYHFSRYSTIRLGSFNTSVLIALVSWIFLCTFFLNEYTGSLKWIEILTYSVGMCFYISAIPFEQFRKGILKCSTILAAISIFVQLGHDLGVIGSTTRLINGTLFKYSLFIFNTEWGNMNRLSSIYWEPGQYQIVLSYILCLFADELSEWRLWKKNIKKFGILFIAFVMTRSTMGYIVLALIVLNLLLNTRVSAKRVYLYPIFLIMGYATIYFTYNSDTVQSKIEMRNSYSEKSSYYVRLADNIALLSCIQDRPITGWSPGSDKMTNTLRARGSLTDSNGILLAGAELGLPYILFWIICFFMGISKMHGKRLGFGLGLALILSQMNEVGYFLPIVFMYIFHYKNYHIWHYSQLSQYATTHRK